MNYAEKLNKILQCDKEDMLLSHLLDICYHFNISNFLIMFKKEKDVFYFTTNSKEGEFVIEHEDFDWHRLAIREKENRWHIESLLYDVKYNEQVVLKNHVSYYVYSDSTEETVFFAHFKNDEIGRSTHDHLETLMLYMRNAFYRVYLNRKAAVEASMEERMEMVNRKISTLQRLAALMQSTLNLDKILEIITRNVSESLGFKVVLLSLFDEKENVLVRAAQHGLDEKVFEKLKKQRVPFSTIKELMIEPHRVSRSYYINHKDNSIRGLNKISYILPDEKEADYINWHPEDILMIPLYTKEDKIIGIMTVDKPVDKQVQIRESVDLLESFAQTAALAIENATLFNTMEHLIEDLEKVSRLSSELTSFLNLDEMLKFLVDSLQENFNYYNVTVWMFDADGQLLPKASRGFYDDAYLQSISSVLSTGEGIVGWVAENGVPVLSKDTTIDPRYVGTRDLVLSEITVPLKISNHIVGVLNVEREGFATLDENDMRIISIIAAHLSTAIDNTFKYEETERISVTDAMTGMFNYRYFMNRLIDELERAKNLGIPLSLIMVDIDYFKEINDTFGHMVGDEVIIQLADLLRNIVRKGDIVTRYGGDEFFIILPGSGKQFTMKLGQRLLDTVKNNKFTKDIKLTLSLGMVTFPDDASTIDSMLRWVDNALYSAKKKGRNRIDG